jgi:multiple sugar transport system ATP-binding protein
VDEAAEMLGLSRLLDRRPGELSGGERQRVAMGRAVVRKPKVFLFDEPLSNLDAALRTELRVEIASLVRRLGVTSLYVTHDQVEAMTMGDRIAVLRGGELQQLGTPREIYERPANTFVAGFLGSPPINWIEVKGEKGAGARWEPLPEIALPEQAMAGIRPEHLWFEERAGCMSIHATVIAHEPLGPETHVLLDAAGTKLRAKVMGFAEHRPGMAVTLSVPRAFVLWFDAATGERLPPG